MLWRAFGVGVAVVVASFGIAVQQVPAAAPASSTLYAVRDYFKVVSIDPQTGAEKLVVDLSTVPTSYGPSSVGRLFADGRKPVLYGLGTVCFCTGKGGALYSQIVTVDTDSNQVRVSPNLPQTLYGGIAVDPSTHSIYGIRLYQPACCTSALERIDVSTGSESEVVQVPWRSPYLDAMTLDPDTGTLYLTYFSMPFAGAAGPIAILSVDTRTGSISTSPTLAEELRTLVFDPKHDALLGFTTSGKLVRVDPKTGHETLVASFPAGATLRDPTLVPKSETMLAVVDGTPNRLVSIDLRTGATTFGPELAGNVTNLTYQRVARGDSGNCESAC